MSAKDDWVLRVEPELGSLRRYARALTRGSSEADDLVQDCLERALRGWGRRRPDEAVRPWLFSIMHNCFIDDLRRRVRRGTEVELEAEDSGLRLAPAQDSAVACRDILSAMERLSPDHRAVLVLVGVEDFSYAEAARILDCPIGTVMSRLSRARTELRTLLDSATRPNLRRVK